ncbi:hypothetical protein IWW50_004326 [Coemansia erecta]|nr:hypothetical protein GGF43_003981 [Coemansia sp. RSA 2618]KAJ2822166.1 hypothetical protein IWW50_004326 [Coemansia erecta]
MNFVIRRLVQWIKALPGTRGHRKLWLPHSPKDYLQRMRGAQHYRREIAPPPPVLIWSLYSGLTSFLAIMVLTLIHKYGAAIKAHHLPFAIAPMGASAVLIFAVPASPLAQPRNVIVGHIIAAVIGTFMHALFKHVAESFRWMPASLAVGVAIALMGLTNCYHPPAGATAFIGGYFGPDMEAVGWWYPLFPVLPVALIMVAIGLILNNVCRVYPVYWFTPVHVRHRPHVPPAAPVPHAQQTKPEGEDAGDAHVPEPSLSLSGSGERSAAGSSASNLEAEVNDEAGNEMEAEVAWLWTRVRELERELDNLKHPTSHTAHRIKTARPDIA